MNRERIDRFCERGMLAVLLAILIYGPLAMGAVLARDFLILQGLTLILILLWLARLWVAPRGRWFLPPASWAVLGFVVYAVARYLTADVELVARHEMIRIFVYAVIFLTVVVFLNSPDHAKIISMAMVFLGMAIAMYAVYQFIARSDRVWDLVSPYADRGRGTYINPNHMAGFLEMLLPLGLAHTLTSRLKVTNKVFVGYATLMIAAGIGVSVSRGSWIACGFALLVFFCVLMFQKQYRLQAVLMLVLLAGSASLFVWKNFEVRKRFEHVLMGGRPSDNRLELWRPACQMWRENFWWGVGPDHYDIRFRAYRPQLVQTQPDHAHNDYLNTLADWGTTGALLVSSTILLVFGGAWRCLRKTRTAELAKSNRFCLVVGASAGVMALLVHSVVDYNMQIPANAILFITMLAMITGHVKFVTERFRLSGGMFARLAASILLAGGFVYLGAQEWRGARETFWLRSAAAEHVFSPDQARKLEKAFQIEPENFETCYQIGECYRMESFEGRPDYAELAQTAMSWYSKAMELNPFDGDNYMRQAMCLDWTERPDEAMSLYIKALDRDPNGSYLIAMVGWHYFELGKYAAAKPWFERSKVLSWQDNTIPDAHLELIESRLAENSSDEGGLRITYPTP